MPGAERGRRAPFLLGGALAGALLAGLAACSGLPGFEEALPSGDGLTRLPLASWVVEGGIEPRAVTACRPPDCAPGVAVGLFRATGAEARLLEAALASPAAFEAGLARLAAERRARTRDRRNLRSRAAVAPWRGPGAAGLKVTLTRDDGGRVAHGIVVARRGPGGLHAAVIAGESEAAVAEAAEVALRAGL